MRVFKGYRSPYNNAVGPGKGGIRFHPGVNIDEAAAPSIDTPRESLASLMGAKGGVIVDSSKLSKNRTGAPVQRLYSGPVQVLRRENRRSRS